MKDLSNILSNMPDSEDVIFFSVTFFSSQLCSIGFQSRPEGSCRPYHYEIQWLVR
uniref:Uncharacterized protein n=1 Tax=Amphimedon queenslandica TaxID=400682 RepID=A0A1X7TI95_AMPQE